jgi:hypothetical protein
LSFIQFLAFLGSRNYQTLAERLTGILLVSSSVYRQSTADFDLLNEQLIWNALADSFIFLRPFIQTHLRSIRQRIFETPDPILASLPADICAFCYQRKENACKISIPTRMQSCGHVFCYYCAAKGKQTGSPCPRCQSSVSGIELVPN